MAQRKAESVTLYCTHCTWGSEVPLAETEESHVFTCAHCSKPIFWYRCDTCGLCYAGTETPKCPICTAEDP